MIIKSFQKNPFRLEEFRDMLATDGELKKLRETYEKGFPEVKDLNTPVFWDTKNNRNYLTKKTDPMGHDRLDTISSLIKGDNLKVLNIGFGTGDLERRFLDDDQIAWIGIDISSWAVKNAKKKYPHARFIKGDIRNINLKKEKIDYVVAMEVLEHIRSSQIFTVLEKILQLLKPKGKLIVSVPLNEGLELMVKKGLNPNAHVRVYTPELIEAELIMSGFQIKLKKELYAFNSLYFLKTIVSKYLIPGIRRPNNIIILAGKI